MAANLQQKLMGIKDSRSTGGMLLRGKNVYKGGATSSHKGKNYSLVAKKLIKR